MEKNKDNPVPSICNLNDEERIQAIALIEIAKDNLRLSNEGKLITKSLLNKLKNGVETNNEEPKVYKDIQSQSCDL